MDYHEAAAKWEELCANCAVLSHYVENIEVLEDRIVYTFDGYMDCVLFWNTDIRKWVSRGDVLKTTGLTMIEHGTISDTLEEAHAKLLRDLQEPI